MNAIPRFFVARPRLAAVVAAVLLISGISALLSAAMRLYPTVAEPTITVSCTYPGANSREVMNTVAGPIEDQINGVEGMLYMTSSCADSGAYSCTVAFEIGTDRDVALMKVQTLVQRATPYLPQEVKNSGLTVSAGTPEDFAILTLRSPRKRMSFQDITDYVFGVVEPAVLRVPGVGSATVRSDKIAMRVWFDPKKMAAIGISPDEAVSAIRQQNVQASIGSVGATPTGDPNGRVVSLIARGRLNRAEEFEDIIIRSKANGGLVRLRDIAQIELGHQAYNYVSFHGDVPAVQILVSLFPGEDLKRTRERLERTLTELERDFPEDLTWEMSYDATRFMYACFRAIVTRAAVGCLVLLAVLFSLLRNVRIVGIVALAILLSILPSFAIVAQTGGSLNVLTLIAAFLAVGITVADVMASLCGASAKSLVWSSLAVVAVFVPICFVNGLTGAIYRQFGLILSSAAFFSVLVALAIVPVLKERWLVADIRLPEFAILSRATFFLSEHRIFLVVLLAFLAIASAAFLKRIPMTLVPDEDTGRINLNVEAPECTRMPLTAEAARQAAEKIGRMKGVSTVLTLCGNSSTGGAGENQALVSVILDDWSARKDPELSVRGIMRRIVEDTSLSPLVAYYPLPPSTVPGLGAAVQLYIMSTSDSDPIRLADEAHRLKRLIARSPLIDRAVCGYTATTPHLRATVDRAKCELMKVPLSTLYATLQNYLGSLYVNDINLGTQVNRVTVEADWGGRAGTEAVKDLFVRSTVGSMVPVGALVSFEEELGPRVCYRYNKYVYCAITIVPADGVSSREAIDETVQILNEELPHGISYAWGSLTFHEMRGGGNADLIVLLIVLIVYLALVGRFNSWRGPVAAVLPSVATVFAAVLGLYLLDVQMSIHARMTVLLLVSVTVKCAVLVMDAADPPKLSAALFDSCIALVLGATPVALASGAGCNALQSVGVAYACGALGVAFGVPLFVPGLCRLFVRVRR